MTTDLLSLARTAADRYHDICFPDCPCLRSIVTDLLTEKGIEPTPGIVQNIVRNAVIRFEAHGPFDRS